MGDRKERDSTSTPLSERVRSALGVVRQQGAASLRGVRRSASEAKDRLKSTQAGERLGAVVETRRAIKKAADAERRGNHPMAYRILEAEVQANPDDARVVTAFWSAALACERAADAVPALLRIIRKLASSGEPQRAAELWLQLREASPKALVDPSSLVRMASALEADGRLEQVTLALRDAAHPRNEAGFSPGLAGRVAEMARQLDPPTALAAARRALTSPDLHETKRARLEDLVAELEKVGAKAAAAAPAEKPATAPAAKPATTPAAAPAEKPATAPAAKPATAPAEDPAAPAEEPAAAPAAAEATERAVEDALEALASTARFSGIKVTEGMPTKLREEAVALQLLAGRKAGIEYSKIDAVAVAEVMGLSDHPVVVIDLLLNWSEEGDSTLRVARLRSDGFDPRMVLETPDDPAAALRSFLSEILVRSGAVPLPDSDAVLGANRRSFDDLESYQREVLRVAPA
jgi:hypothetical protein